MSDWVVLALAFAISFSIGSGARLAVDLYRHGWDNHLCSRKCCA